MPRRRSVPLRIARGLFEVGLILALYVGYSWSRLLASDDFGLARERARALLSFEKDWHLGFERSVISWFTDIPAIGIPGSYYYATAHYLVTAAALIWLHTRARHVYRPARNALIAATLSGLVIYLLVPMAPPRLAGLGHVDVMKEYAAAGWWGGAASAPRGYGQYTNELAAMPSLHAGWALWVLIAVTWAGVPLIWRRLAALHVLLTAVVVVGTGNHWVLDVLAGWAVVAIAAYAWRPGSDRAAGSEEHAAAEAARPPTPEPGVPGATVRGRPREG